MTAANLLEKGLPANLDAERFVLGSILLDDAMYVQAAGALDWSRAVIDSSHVRVMKGGPEPGRAPPGRGPGRGPAPAGRPGNGLAYQSAREIWHTEGRCVLLVGAGARSPTTLGPRWYARTRAKPRSTEESLPCTPLLPN